MSRKCFLRVCRSHGYPDQKMVLGTSLPGLLFLMGFCHGEVMNYFTLPNIMVKGGARAPAGGPPPLNPSELFTGQLLPAKPAIPDSQQPIFPLKEIGFESEGHSRNPRGGENWAALQSDPPGRRYYGNSLTNWEQYWEIEAVPDSRHDYKQKQDYFADPH